MMHQGMDLSRFKKVSGDKSSSTLRHAKGHEIKIAHKGVSPKMLEELTKMPVHMADGGEAEEPEEDRTGPEEDFGDVAPESGDSPETSEAQDQPETDDSSTETPESSPAAAPAETPPAGEDKNASDVIQVVGKRPVAPAIPTPQELDNEDALFAQDLQRGHVKPETINSLFAKQDSLGKIGTLFGLLVSGAGSGLSGQPNAVLDMMKQTVENDFKAQQHSNENAQNWLRLSQAHHMQQAQIGEIGAHTKEAQARTENIKADTDLKAINSAKNKMDIAIPYYLGGLRDKLPPGPLRDQMDQMIGQVITPAVQAQVSQRNAQTHAQLTTRAAIRGELPTPQDIGLVDTRKIQALATKSAMMNSVKPGMPGMMLPGQADQLLKEAGAVNKNRTIYNTWKNNFEQLDQKFAAGQLNKANYETIMAHTSAQLTPLIGQAEAEGLTKALYPDWKDFGDTRDTKAKQGVEQFKAQEAGASTLDAFPGMKPAFPAPPKLTKRLLNSSKGQEKSSEKIKEFGGKKYKRGPNGESVLVK